MTTRIWQWASRALALGLVSAAVGCHNSTIVYEGCDRDGHALDAGAREQPCSADDECDDDDAVCDPAAHVCRPRSLPASDGGDGGPDASRTDGAGGTFAGCASNADCAAGEVCSAGVCRAPESLCRFNDQCRAGQVCADGRCVATCVVSATPSGCAAGQACVGGRCVYGGSDAGACACAVSEVCAAGACLRACATDAGCDAGQYCDRGACRVDDRRPPPFCATDADCAPGSVCREGVCRAACPTGTDAECLRHDVNFDLCGADRLCTNAREQRPECAVSADCTGGRACVDAVCE